MKKKITSYVEVEIDRADLVTMTEAAKMVGVTVQGIVSALERGRLTEIIDESAPAHHGRRLLIRSEVADMAGGFK